MRLSVPGLSTQTQRVQDASSGRQHSAVPAVTIAVVTYNSAQVLRGCIEALPGAMEAVPWRLVVADNASQDHTLLVLADSAPDASVVNMPGNLGYSAGINAIAAVTEPSDGLLIMNPDIRLGPGSGALLARAARQPGVGIAVPRLLDPAGRLDPHLRHEPTVPRALAEAVVGGRLAGRLGIGEVYRRPSVYGRPTRADWAGGAVLMVSAECRRAVGPWDESLFLYAEEIDFCLRAKDAGFECTLVPEAATVHLRGGGERVPELRSLMSYNKWQVYQRRRGAGRGKAFRAALVLNEAIRSIWKSPARTSLRALASPHSQPALLRDRAHI
jgi:N-acetylglucosaminyl-diphospho-decaprenol L-rhamnosyltransferase